VKSSVTAVLRVPFILLALGALFVSALALGQARIAVLPLSEVKPGMKGYGLSVFRGETPERFDVEIIDVLHNFRPDQDLILARTAHPVLASALVVGGMSGSPVYLDGKLIGAYAYGWQFGKEPVVGITPIENMLKEMARPVDPRIWKALGTLPTMPTAAPTKPKKTAALDFDPARDPMDFPRDAFTALRRHGERHAASVSTSHGNLIPATTPLMIGGMTERAMSLLGAEMERFGIVPLQGGGGGAKAPSATRAQYVDGGSIGVQLIRGDISATGIGTVTHVAGDRLVAFGHPMFNAGQVGLATCTARVLHVLSSTMRSFKIAEAQTPLGTLIHDRLSAIVIDQNLKADMIPMRVRIHGVPGALRTEWNVEIASQRMLTPSLAFGALFSAIDSTVSDNADATYEIRSRVSVEGHGTIETHDVGFTPGGPADGQAIGRAKLFGIIGATYGNPFEDTRITGIEVDYHVRFENDVTSILDAMVAGSEVDPGRDVNLHVTLRRFGQPEEIKTIPVHIPESAAGDSVELLIEPGDEVQLDHPRPDSLDDLLRVARSGYASTSLVVSMKLPSQGVKLRGHLVRSLPGSALDALSSANGAERVTPLPTIERREIPVGHVLKGSARLKLNVRREPLR
jgi:SpoIVB peptidase S55